MTEFEFLDRLSATPKKNTNIYRLRAPGVNERSLRRMVKRFNLRGSGRGTEILKDDVELTYVEGPFVVRLWRRSGALRYYDRTRWQVDDGELHMELSDGEVVDIAKGFITESELAPVKECKLLKVTHLYVETCKRGSNEGEQRIIDAGVVFQRTVDGVPVDGPGGNVIVHIDHKGEVTGCDRIWREIQQIERPVPFEKLRSPGYAEQNLKRYWRPYGLQRIRVEETRFGYFELGRAQSQRFLQPAYIMPMRLITADGRMTMKSVHVALAATKPVGRIMPRRKVTPEEPLRTG